VGRGLVASSLRCLPGSHGAVGEEAGARGASGPWRRAHSDRVSPRCL